MATFILFTTEQLGGFLLTNMLLSNYLLSGGVKPYLEYAWVTAPNAAGQTITNNTITTLTIDTEVADTGNNGSISGNQITLAAGTYYYEANIRGANNNADNTSLIFSLYNSTDNLYVTKTNELVGTIAYPAAIFKGQISIPSTKVFELRIMAATQTGSFIVRSGWWSGTFSNSTAGADQRTTIKLWKLA